MPRAVDAYRDFTLVRVTAKALAVPPSVYAGNWVYSWQEQYFDPVSGEPRDNTDGRFGTYDADTGEAFSPLLEANNVEIAVGSYVFARMMGNVDGQPTFWTVAPSGGVMNVIQVTSATPDADGYQDGIVQVWDRVTRDWVDGELVKYKEVNVRLIPATYRLLGVLDDAGDGTTSDPPLYVGNYDGVESWVSNVCVSKTFSSGFLADVTITVEKTNWMGTTACNVNPDGCCPVTTLCWPGKAIPRRLCFRIDFVAGGIIFDCVQQALDDVPKYLYYDDALGKWVGDCVFFPHCGFEVGRFEFWCDPLSKQWMFQVKKPEGSCTPWCPFGPVIVNVPHDTHPYSWVFFAVLGAPCNWDAKITVMECVDTPVTYNCVSGTCTDPGDGTGTFSTLAACEAACVPSWNCETSGCVDPGDGTGTFKSLSSCLSACGISPSWNCVGGSCVDPGNGSGAYSTLSACLAACGVPESYNCVSGECVDPGDGSGTYSTLSACEAACGPIARTALGTATGSSFGAADAVATLAGVTVPDGVMLVVNVATATSATAGEGITSLTVTFNGSDLTQGIDTGRNGSGIAISTSTWYAHVLTGATADVVATATPSGASANSHYVVLTASYYTNLANYSVDQQGGNNGAASSPTVGPTSPSFFDNEAANSPVAGWDLGVVAPGTPGDGFSLGQTVTVSSFAGWLSLHELYKYPFNSGTQLHPSSTESYTIWAATVGGMS